MLTLMLLGCTEQITTLPCPLADDPLCARPGFDDMDWYAVGRGDLEVRGIDLMASTNDLFGLHAIQEFDGDTLGSVVFWHPEDDERLLLPWTERIGAPVVAWDVNGRTTPVPGRHRAMSVALLTSEGVRTGLLPPVGRPTGTTVPVGEAVRVAHPSNGERPRVDVAVALDRDTRTWTLVCRDDMASLAEDDDEAVLLSQPGHLCGFRGVDTSQFAAWTCGDNGCFETSVDPETGALGEPRPLFEDTVVAASQVDDALLLVDRFGSGWLVDDEVVWLGGQGLVQLEGARWGTGIELVGRTEASLAVRGRVGDAGTRWGTPSELLLERGGVPTEVRDLDVASNATTMQLCALGPARIACGALISEP